MSIELKGGATTEDLRLDRVPFFDDRSRDFPITAVVPEPLETRSWECRPRLNQGSEGACVGFGWSHLLRAQPAPVRRVEKQTVDAIFARERIYWKAQELDDWPGGSYPGATPRYEGTAVLAGAKVAQELGAISGYRWAFGIDDVLRALSHAGPVVFGTDWHEGMYDTRPSGLLEVAGAKSGGHCWLGRGVILKPRLRGEKIGEPLVKARNSWGEGWGVQGDFYITASALEGLLKAGGEACVPVK